MDNPSKVLLRKVLKDNGYSITTARQVVCGLLWKREPQSIHDLTIRSRGLLDRASLYRTLALFERLGLVRRVYIGWKYRVELSDVLTHHHHHISCTGCGRVVAIKEDEGLEALLTALAARQGFSAVTHQLELQGRCAHCISLTTDISHG